MKTKMLSVLFFAFCLGMLFVTPAQAQVHVASDGDVGIGTTTPSGRLHVLNNTGSATYTGYFRNENTSGSKYGIYNYVSGTGTGSKYGLRTYTYNDNANTSSTYGTYNFTIGAAGYLLGNYNYAYQATGATSTAYGSYNYLYSSSSTNTYAMYNYSYSPSSVTGNRYGLYNVCNNYGTGTTTYALYSSVNSGSGTRYAGYFNGDVHVNGNLTWTSDERTKEEVNDLQGALDLIAQLQPKSYKFREDADLNLPAGKQYGFVAQELETTLPGLVKTVAHPSSPSEQEIKPQDEAAVAAGEDPQEVPAPEEATTDLKAVNYVAIIPILVQAVKEQQQSIEAQKEEIRMLREMLENK